MEKKILHVFPSNGGQPLPMELTLEDGVAQSLLPCEAVPGEKLYLSDGFIDSHAHVYDGATNLGVDVDRIGLQTGVHLVVDAGSSGAINFPCFRDYVMPAHKTPVKAFLNISTIGLVTKQPYHDRRTLDIPAAVEMIRQDGGEYLLGIKVLSSGLIVEDAGIEPMRAAYEAAHECGVPVMAHLTEGPPTNEETMAFMGKGDIITHCFHGAPNLEANRRAAKGKPLDLRYCSEANVMWNPDGTPTEPLRKALERGVYLDVGHGAGSFDAAVAGSAIRAGVRNFSISTDAHIRNVNGAVRSLTHTMSKFLSLGMELENIVASVTSIPAKQLRLKDYGGKPLECGTVFRVRQVTPEDPPFIDSWGKSMDVPQVIEPVAILKQKKWISLDKTVKNG